MASVRSAVAVSLFAASAAFAQAPAEGDVAELSLEDLLNQQVGVASRTVVSSRESPGIITVVTREEIENSGARDLIDILRLVPGFEFGVDVQQIVGAGFRGVWGHEGKILLLLDGQVMNENLYSTLQFGQHFLANTIERVEIIRGPGSAIYGGYAELAVINVVSRSAENLQGANVSVTAGKMSAVSTTDIAAAVSAAKKMLDGDLEVSLNAYGGDATRSGGTYRDFFGLSADLDGSSGTDPLMLNLGVKYKFVKARFIYDNYRVQSRDGFGDVLPEVGNMAFPTMLADVQADLKLGDKITLTPRFNFKHATPWYSGDDTELFYKKSTDRFLGSLILAVDPFDGLNIIAGVEGYLDQAAVLTNEIRGAQTDFGGEPTVAYSNVAAFAQGLWRNEIVNVTAGARFEQHSAVGSSFVPRVGLTKVIDRIHFKALYSGAFRAPGIENINLGLDILPERTWVAEAEAGYQFTDNVFARVNVFDINIYRPIVYSVDPATGEEAYLNFPRTGTRGFEAEVKTRFDKISADVTYSYYETDERNQVPDYAVEGRPDLLLALPQHKITLNGSYQLTENLSINPSGAYLINRYAYFPIDDTGDAFLRKHPDTLLLNLFLNMRDLGIKGLGAGAGVYNLLNSENNYLQPYNGGHAPLPAAGRTLIVKASYALPF